MKRIIENAQTYSLAIPSGAYLLLVESKRPWFAPDFLIRIGIKKVVAEYQTVPGLLRKNFTIGQGGVFRGLYTWKNREVLNAYYNDAKIKAIEEKRGMRPILSVFEVVQSKDFSVKLPPSRNSTREWSGKYVVTIISKDFTAQQMDAAKTSLDQALEWAAKSPAMAKGKIEVRPVMLAPGN